MNPSASAAGHGDQRRAPGRHRVCACASGSAASFAVRGGARSRSSSASSSSADDRGDGVAGGHEPVRRERDRHVPARLRDAPGRAEARADLRLAEVLAVAARSPAAVVALGEHEPRRPLQVEPDAGAAAAAVRGSGVDARGPATPARARRPRRSADEVRHDRAGRELEPRLSGGQFDRLAPDGAQRTARVEILDRPLSRHRATFSPIVPAAKQSRRSGPLRGTLTVGPPLDLGDPDGAPLTRRPGVPGGNAARRIVSRNLRPRTGCGSRTVPSAATATGGESLSRTCVGPPHARHRVQLQRRHGLVRSVVQLSHAWRPSSHAPTHGCSVPSNALDAAQGGPALEHRGGLERPRPGDIGEQVGGRAGDPAVERPRARRRRVEHAGDAGLAVEPVAHQRGAGRAALVVAAERVVAGRALEQIRQVGPRIGSEARARPASADAAPRAPRRPGATSSRIPPAPAVGPSGLRTSAIRMRSVRTAWRSGSSVFQPGLTSNRRPWTSTAVTVARRSLYGRSLNVADVARLGERDLERVPVLRHPSSGRRWAACCTWLAPRPYMPSSRAGSQSPCC